MKTIMILLTIFVLLLVLGLSYLTRQPIYYDGPYKGILIDADTGKPIQGAVILGSWSYRVFESSMFYDAKEAVSDEDGMFKIPGLGVRFFSSMNHMIVEIFKNGYEPINHCYWDSLLVNVPEQTKMEDGWLIISLRRQRTDSEGPHGPMMEIPEEKKKLMTNEIKKYHLERKSK